MRRVSWAPGGNLPILRPLLGWRHSELEAVCARSGLEPAEDLVSALLQVHDGGDALSEQELFSTVVLLIVAGHETTVNLIANATLALLEGHVDSRESRDCFRHISVRQIADRVS